MSRTRGFIAAGVILAGITGCGVGYRSAGCSARNDSNACCCAGKTVQTICDNPGRDLDEKAVECGGEGLGQGQGQMGRLPKAVKGTETLRAKKLVIPLQMHDELRSSSP